MAARFELHAIGSAADHEHLPVGPARAIADERFEQDDMALPVAHRRHDAECGAIGKAQPGPRGRRVAWNVAREVDAGRNGRHALERDAVVARELAAQRFAGGDDMLSCARVEPPGGGAIADPRRHVARAHDRWCVAQRGAGECRQPGVGRAVRVQKIEAGAVARDPAPQRKKIRGTLAADVHVRHRNSHALGGRSNRRLGRCNKRYAVTTIEKSARLGENADFLAAPATRVLGVHDRQRSVPSGAHCRVKSGS